MSNASASSTAALAQGRSIESFLGAVGGSFALFGAQFLLFYLLRNKFTRIYRPKTYLVPEKNRTDPPPDGFFKWALPVFKTSNAELISKCGLDAYFFLRYLRMLLKVFIPSSFLILPILLPINSAFSGKAGVEGLDRLGWQNFDPAHTSRLWAHLILQLLFLFWILYVIYDELRGYIRVRQAYLTSPQHRLRASATTVLVTSIPQKWCTYEALDGLYDVFPGGIRNIWINRNFDELNDKVKLRNKLAKKLEGAETSLIRNAKQKHMEMEEKKAKEAGQKMNKKQKVAHDRTVDDAALALVDQPGLSSGNPHQALTIDEELHGVEESSSDDEVAKPEEKSSLGILGRGFGTIGHGIKNIGGGLGKFGKLLVKDVKGVTGATVRPVDEAALSDAEAVEQSDKAKQPVGPASFDGLHESGAEVAASAERSMNPSGRPMDSGALIGQTPTVTSPSELRTPANRSSSKAALKGGDFDYLAPQIREVQSPEPGQVGRADQPLNIAIRTPEDHETLTNNNLGVPVEERDFTDEELAIPKEKLGRLDWAHNDFLQQNNHKRTWKNFYKSNHGIAIPSPEPHYLGDEQFPLPQGDEKDSVHTQEGNQAMSRSKLVSLFRSQGRLAREEPYPPAYDPVYAEDQGADTEAEWKKYLKPGDRDHMRLQLFGWGFMPFLPAWMFLGKKVDTIYHCRREVARLNLEIEQDQNEPEKYPLMNSAFIQFNHQVAAHMACQSVSHHVPNHMAPRHVEIAPGDVIWDNLSIIWWERFVRIGLVTAAVAGLIITWAVPVSFTAALSNLSAVATYSGFGWLNNIPTWLRNGMQGILPWVLLQSLLALLPFVLKFAAKFQGVPTGNDIQLSVQGYYFAFLFIQIFFVVTVANSLLQLVQLFQDVSSNPTAIVTILANNIPTVANYFFSYMLLQALSVSAGQLAQIGTLALWFLWRPIVDSTARQKFKRQLNLSNINWGTYFPTYTNLACIGIIFSVISPLIMVFNIITFSLFWVVCRYSTLYVSKFRFDTGGLLFPKAVNQLFTGLYFMEIALIGLFFLVRDTDGNATCIPQAVIMIVALCFTILYHVLINVTFAPLYRYMPITLEDDAVRRDEEFERVQMLRWRQEEQEERLYNKSTAQDHPESEEEDEGIEARLEREEHQEEEGDKQSQRNDDIKSEPRQQNPASKLRTGASYITMGAADRLRNGVSKNGHSTKSWADRSKNQESRGHDSTTTEPSSPSKPTDRIASPVHRRRKNHARNDGKNFTATFGATLGLDKLEAAGGAGIAKTPKAVGDMLFGGFVDELEDLTAEERDRLVQRAFQHEALRARRPVIWIPRDDLGVSDDEIRRTQLYSEKNIWISNEFTALDSKARVIFSKAPPDFAEVDLIEL